MTRRWLGTLAVAAPALSVALVALLHVLDPETNDTEAISEYALGDYGFLMNAAFVAAAVGFAALAGALAGRVTHTWSARAAIALLVAAAVGWLLLGMGNIDPEGAERTTHGVIHGIGFLLGFPSMFLALLLLGRAFGRDVRWRPFRLPLLTVAVAALVAFVLAFMDVAAPVLLRLSEVLVMLAVAWTALRVRRTEPSV
jgi:hypothetical protein